MYTVYFHILVCDGYRLCRAAKLLMSLGYGNFINVVQYDIFASALSYVSSGKTWSVGNFRSSSFSLNLTVFETSLITNSPNLSLLPLLAYHKICNDHYRNEKWQPFEPWTCNIDYLSPSDNMNAFSFINSTTFSSQMSSLIDLENSNLPIDYFTSVLPRAQYGDESAVPVDFNKSDALLNIDSTHDATHGALFDNNYHGKEDTLIKPDVVPTSSHGYFASPIKTHSTPLNLVGFSGDLTASSSLKISALRSATALQIHLVVLIIQNGLAQNVLLLLLCQL